VTKLVPRTKFVTRTAGTAARVTNLGTRTLLPQCRS
jgi:hypothetical protein